ncbi:uncharacterized protein B0P05DRAFT_558534 [Gilbertella persicaria]|uniref:uncharacterized protein n=1 Tax=Gilbertella persicaria TaxID=101096 RepID=UPI00221EDBB6|nr:uncharacterized protein B0P05DRAFT_558534 [Gilbertella persicaria]KAI8059411.1 hypothetical protein B0P05DRAFT_558534 [Gilbertella persicaria]
MSHRSSSIRRRGTGSFSMHHDYPGLTSYRDSNADTPLPHHQRTGSFHSFFKEDYQFNPADDQEDVKTDVLFPRYRASVDDHVDIAAFHRMVQHHTRKMSVGTVPLSKTLSKQNQLYGPSSVLADSYSPLDIRFRIYSAQKNAIVSASLQELLTEEGRKALESVVRSKGWWVDVLCPSLDEMRILSKTFHIHPLTTEDIQAQEPREKVELFPNYTFVCFRAFEVDALTDRIRPFNFYSLIFKEGLLTFHFKKSEHIARVRERCDQLKEFMPITPDWINYALVDSVTDSFAPIILQVEMEAVSIDELSLVLKESEQADMLKRISRCRKKSTQLTRLLGSKLDVIKSLMKRYEDKSKEYAMLDQSVPLNHHLAIPGSPGGDLLETKKAFSDVLLYLGDIQDHVVTMAQNINHYDRILHRAHTNYLAQVNLELTQTYNMTNSVMNRLTFLATVFIPLTLIGSLWGMNVAVPGKEYQDPVYFWWILGGMAVYCTGCLFYGKRVGLL